MADNKDNEEASTGADDGDDGKERRKKIRISAGGMPRRSFYIVLALLIGLGVLVWRELQTPASSPGPGGSVATIEKPRIGGPFTLVDQHGRTVTEADFKGKYMLIYFGYTFCPDVCPTSLSVISDALDMIGGKAARVTPILITVDPARDTPAQMKMYVEYFHPSMVGLSGSSDQVAAAAKAYKVYYAKVDGDNGEDYLMDHSSITYLMAPGGEFVAHFGNGVDAEEMARRLMSIL